MQEKIYVNKENAIKLKELGYNEWAVSLYCLGVFHKGQPLGSDEEFELKCEGLESEIEYVPFGDICYFNNKNDEFMGENSCSRPLAEEVIQWLLEKHNLYIAVLPTFRNGGYVWRYDIYELVEIIAKPFYETFEEREEAIQSAIKKALVLIENKKENDKREV